MANENGRIHSHPSAIKNAMATLGAGLVVMGLYVGFDAARHRLGELEVSYSPVLKDVTVCSGQVDKASGACIGELVHYEDFVQTSAVCDGRDAIVSGTMSKVRADAEYIAGAQTIFFTRPDGMMRRAFFEFEDQQEGVPKSRPAGVQDWGPWRLLGGCVTAYTQWFTVVEHRPWHRFFPLTTRSDAFPLPRAVVD